MKNQEFLKMEGSFSSLKPLEIPERTSHEDIGEVGKEKIISLKKVISEIKKLVIEREKLSAEVFAEGEQIKTEINNFLLENEGEIKGTSGDFVREKNDLRHKKMEISELQLNEKIECWKDVALLKKELRIYEKELMEKEARLNFLDKIMGED